MSDTGAAPAMNLALAERIQAGDGAAEEEMVNTYWPGVFRIAMIRTRDRDAALDIAQDTFMAVLQELRAGKLREQDKLAAFIQGVANNLIKNFQRKMFRLAECELDQYLGKLDTVEELETAERRRLAQDAVKSLGAKDQRILLLWLVDELPLAEVAERLNMSPESVRARKSRAIKRLKKKLQRVSHS